MKLTKKERDKILEHYLDDSVQDLRVFVNTEGLTVKSVTVVCAQCNEILAKAEEK